MGVIPQTRDVHRGILDARDERADGALELVEGRSDQGVLGLGFLEQLSQHGNEIVDVGVVDGGEARAVRRVPPGQDVLLGRLRRRVPVRAARHDLFPRGLEDLDAPVDQGVDETDAIAEDLGQTDAQTRRRAAVFYQLTTFLGRQEVQLLEYGAVLRGVSGVVKCSEFNHLGVEENVALVDDGIRRVALGEASSRVVAWP